MGAAGDGRAPTEELSVIQSKNFCSTRLVKIEKTLEAEPVSREEPSFC
jgi:hypothetical protein